MSKKISNNILLAVHTQIVWIDEQIAFLQKSKQTIFESAWLTKQTYYNFLKERK